MTQKTSSTAIPQSNTQWEQDALREVAGHLVALAGLSQPLANGVPSGDAHCFFCSGFVIAIRRRWYFATAGHILHDIESAIRSRKVTVEECRLLDCFGLNVKSKEPIPFDYAGAFKLFQFDEQEGIDFGLIELGPNHRQLLRANGVTPISKKHWKNQDKSQFDEHFMLGLASDSIERSVSRVKGGYVLRGKPVPNLIYIKRVTRPAKSWLKCYPRFIGRIRKNHRSAVGNIDGMSGGPIFGIKNQEPGLNIVAIQSAWLEDKGITFGCPIPVLTRLAEKLLKQNGR